MVKTWKQAALVGAIAAGFSCAASLTQAGSITTTFASNNAQSGNMFDATVFGNALTVTGMDLNLDSGTWNIELYTKSGSYAGSETTPGDWTLASTNNGVVGAGLNNATFVDVTDIVMAANAVTGLYVTVTNGTAINYTNGANSYANADLRLDLGVGKAYPFGSTFTPRTWNGTIYYTTDGIRIPEPSTLAILGLGLGLAGLGFARRRKAA